MTDTRDCLGVHLNVVAVKRPHSGFKHDELQSRCDDCWNWLDADGNAPALGEGDQYGEPEGVPGW